MDKIVCVQAEEHTVIHHSVNAIHSGILGEQEFLRPDGHDHVLVLAVLVHHVLDLGPMPLLRKQIGSAALDYQLGVHHIGAANKGRYEQVGRPLVDILGRSDVLDNAILHDSDPVGNGHGLLLVMGDVNSSDIDAVLDVLDDGPHLHPELGVQIGERLIKKQNVGLDTQGTS